MSLPDSSMACNQSQEVVVWDTAIHHYCRILHEEINWRSDEPLLLTVEVTMHDLTKFGYHSKKEAMIATLMNKTGLGIKDHYEGKPNYK